MSFAKHEKNKRPDAGSERVATAITVPVILLALMFTVLAFNSAEARQREVKSAEQVLLSSAQEQAQTLDVILDGQFALLEAYASVFAEEGMNPSTVTARLGAFSSSNSFLHISYSAPSGVSYVDSGIIIDVSGRAYFAEALSGKRSLERVTDAYGDDSIRFVLAVPVVKDGVITGVVHGSYDEEKLSKLLISRAFGGAAYSAICDDSGLFIVGPDAPDATLTSDNLFTAVSTVKLGKGYSEAQVRADIASGANGMFSYEADGAKRYAIYMPLDILTANGRRWTMVNILPGAVIDAKVAGWTYSSAGLMFAVVAASATMIFFIARRERANAKRAKEDSERLRISEELFRFATVQGERSVARFDIKSGIYYDDSEILAREGFPSEIEDMPEPMIDAGIVAESSAQDMRAFFKALRDGEPTVSGDALLRMPDGAYRTFHSEAKTVYDDDNEPVQAIIVFYDVTDIREKEAFYKKWQQSLAEKEPGTYTLFRCNISRGTSLDSSEGSLLNIAFSKDAVTFDERTMEYAMEFVHPDDRDEYLALLNADSLLANYYCGRRGFSMDYREIAPLRPERWLRLTVELVEYPNSSDIEAYLMYENIDESKRAELLAKERAETDPLTGLLNRTTFISRFEAMMADTKANGEHHALLMLDIDGFKLVNDSFGHAAGDQELIYIANSLRSVLRHGDLVSRFGGDEFMVCLKDMPYDAVIGKKAQQICALVRKAFSMEMRISASVGIAVYPRDGDNFDALYKNVDTALYYVKENGKDSFAFYGEDMNSVQPPQGGASALGQQSRDKKRRMLIVDDNRMNQEMLVNIFRGDYIVETASDGREALIRLRHYGAGISVVLLDLVMPGMDGFAVLEKMRENFEMQSIPVIVVSGQNERETGLKTLKYGAADFVTKPVDPDLIRIRVHSAVSKAENERLRAQNSYLLLQSSEEAKYRTVLESTGTVVIEYDWLSGVFSYDPSVSKYIYGNYDNRKLWHIFLSDMVAGAMDVQTMQQLVHSVAGDRTQQSGSMVVQLKTPSREKHWFRMSMFKRTDEFQLTGKIILTFNDINEEVIADEMLRFRAERDPLTGLYNRQTFLRKVEEIVRTKDAKSYILSVGDIDSFKVVNDMFGHAEGDRLLKYTADTLQRDADMAGGLCGRLNNDVFATMLPCSAAVIDALTAYPRELLADYPIDLELTCSIGHYLIDEPEMAAESMLDRASLAKQSVKEQYGSKMAWYDAQMREKLLLEQEIIGDMEAALAGGQFDVYLQPQYNHSTGEICGAETLVRWFHPVKGMITPNKFIPVFEKNGFITRLDEFVWDRAAQLIASWMAAGRPPVPVSVNVSRLDTGEPLLCEKLLAIVHRYNIPIDLFRLEITEGLFVEDSKRLIEVVNKLHENGFLIEMDDFGSGYSSLNILKDVAVDILKLDMRFFSGTGDQERSSTILNAVMRMARWLNIPVIAEGVEESAQADFLSSIGCRVIQGYLYARPMPVDQFEDLLSTGDIAKYGGLSAAADPFVATRAFWDSESADSRMFNEYIGAAVIYEFHRDVLEPLRANAPYYELMRLDKALPMPTDGLSLFDAESAEAMLLAAQRASASGREERVEVRRMFPDGSTERMVCTLRFMARDADGAVLLCVAVKAE